MRKILLIALLSAVVLAAKGQHNRALLIGVAHYPEGSGWRSIHADNDVVLLSGLLEGRFQVTSLLNEGATCDNISRALDNLEQTTHQGDTVLISFSCHGQQMVAGGSEEPDSLDEALIPYDACVNYSDGYKGENHLRDDILSACVERVRRKAGKKGFVLVLLDSCHSGDSFKDTKDSTFYRGGYPVFGLRGGGEVRPKKALSNKADIESVPGLSDVLYVGACQSYQLNSEMRADDGNWYGSLSYAFFESFKAHSFSDIDQLCLSIKRNVLRYNKRSRQCPEFASSLRLTGLQMQNEESEGEAEPSAGLITDNGSLKLGFITGFGLLSVIVILFILWRRK